MNLNLQQKDAKRYTHSQYEEWLAPYLTKIKADRVAGKSQAMIYNVLVVIHIIHNGDAVNTSGNIVGKNISNAQDFSQTQVLNKDYPRLVGSSGGVILRGWLQT